MATITWQGGNCHIVKFEPGDLYIDENGGRHKIVTKQYRLICGASRIVNMIDHEVDWRIHDIVKAIWVNESGPEFETLVAEKPNSADWFDYINKAMNYSRETPAFCEIYEAVTEFVEPEPSFWDTIAYTPKDLIITCLGVAVAMLGIMR